EFTDAEAEAELIEGICKAIIGAVQMFAFGDKLQCVVALDACLSQDLLERLQITGVDDQQFVLVKLNFHRLIGRDNSETGAAIVQEEVLEVVDVAEQHHAVNLLAHQVAMFAAGRVVAALQNDIDHLAEWAKQVEKNVEELLGRDGSREHGNF